MFGYGGQNRDYILGILMGSDPGEPAECLSWVMATGCVWKFIKLSAYNLGPLLNVSYIFMKKNLKISEDLTQASLWRCPKGISSPVGTVHWLGGLTPTHCVWWARWGAHILHVASRSRYQWIRWVSGHLRLEGIVYFDVLIKWRTFNNYEAIV